MAKRPSSSQVQSSVFNLQLSRRSRLGAFPLNKFLRKPRAMPNATRQISSSRPLQTPPSTELQDGIPLPEPVHLHTFLSNNTRFSITSCTAPSFDACCAARVKVKKPKGFRKIMFSKSTRIAILLGVDSSFFLLELI